MIKFFSCEDMVTIPKKHETFRVGPFVGKCIFVNKSFAVMDIRKVNRRFIKEWRKGVQ